MNYCKECNQIYLLSESMEIKCPACGESLFENDSIEYREHSWKWFQRNFNLEVIK